MDWSARRTRFALLAPLFVLGTACDDDLIGDDDPADAIQTMRLTIGTNQVLTVNEGGTVAGGPIVITGNTPITATFLDGSGAAVAGLDDFELRVTSQNTSRVTFAQTSAFAGTLTKVSAGSTVLEIGLWHNEEQHFDFGDFDVPINVL